MALIDQALVDGVAVKAWTFDEFYSRDGKFLDGLDERKQAFVGEVPPNATMWLRRPKVLKKPSRNGSGRPKRYPRLAARDSKASEVQNLAKYAPGFTQQTPQRWRVRDSHQGPEIWEVRWHVAYRKTHTTKLVSNQCTLLVAKNVRTNETKYFISNCAPWNNGWTVRELLRIAFARWKVEACFREVKEELGWDHFECRGWGCVHRHLITTIVTQLFCARVRKEFTKTEHVTDAERLTLEQVRRAADVYIATIDLPRKAKYNRHQAELARMQYHQRRNAQASRSHRKGRYVLYRAMGIDPDQVKSVELDPPSRGRG